MSETMTELPDLLGDEDLAQSEPPPETERPTVDMDAAKRALLPTLRAAAFGEIMSLLMQSRRHRNVPLSSVSQKMVPAFITQQYVLAKAAPDADNAPPAPVGFAFWASVSDEVDRRLVEELDKPIALKAEEWKGGDNIWLLDMVAPAKVGPTIIREIQEKVGKDKPIKMRVAGADGKPRIRIIEAATRETEPGAA